MKTTTILTALLLVSCTLVAQKYRVQALECNSTYMDYAPVVHDQGIVFCSNRPDGGMVAVVDSLGVPTTSLYRVAVDTEGKCKRVRPFAPEINSRLSEGASCFDPDHKAFYYTATISGAEEEAQKLGIFHTRKQLGVWSTPVAFPFNSTDDSFDVAHPAVSPDGQLLVFSSNVLDPVSPADLFVCFRTEEAWSAPQPLGSSVNSSNREVFPSFDHFGRLYFASDRNGSRSDLDIYYTMQDASGNWVEPVALPKPINSTFDDFGMAVSPGGDSGFFTSSRSGDTDNIFQFDYIYPTFSGCLTSQEPPLCYGLEETSIEPIDSLPFKYVWEISDGTELEGFYVEHCFPGVGDYQVSFNVYDTISGEHYARVTETQLVIEHLDQPFIHGPDTVLLGDPAWFKGEQRSKAAFEVDQFFWDIGDALSRGSHVMHVFESPGLHNVRLGALSIPTNGRVEKACVSHEVVVMQPGTWMPSDRPWIAQLSDVMRRTGQSDLIQVADPVDSAVFFVEFAQTPTPLKLSDNFFDKVDHQITERFNPQDSTFAYSIGKVADIAGLMNLHRSLRDSGYADALVRESSTGYFDAQVKKTGYYMPDSVRHMINQKINEFANIEFDYNSDRITPGSLDNLEYILAVLRFEPQIRLWIKAHTDDTGTLAFNHDLSERRAASVQYFFTSRGIAVERFDVTGYGASRPVTTNETEEGRSRNRRVEFEIRLETVHGDRATTSETTEQ